MKEVLLEIYSSLTCGHCIELKSRLSEMIKELNKQFKTVVKEYVYQNKEDEYRFEGIDYFPFIKIIINDETYEYKGDRSVEDIIKFIKSKDNFIGGDKYYNKYIKYKRKYLKLKNNFKV